jgi:hypothetical protein
VSVQEPAAGRLIRYLALPRPGDLIKAWIFPIAFGVGLAAQGFDGTLELVRALLVWLALELLIYQARYQWNDIRGFRADLRHPDANERGRLPGPASRARLHVTLSACVAAGRLATAVLLVVLLPELDLALPILASIGAVFGLAVPYETVRAWISRTPDTGPARPKPSIVLLWLLAGGGYAIRGLAGLGMATNVESQPGLAIAACLCLWAFGVAFVTLRWALEALPFARYAAGRLVWSADREQARDHLVALGRWLGTPPPVLAATAPDLRDWRPLRRRTPLLAPWNIATVVAGTAAGVSGAMLTGDAPLASIAGAAAGLVLASALVTTEHGIRVRIWTGAGLALIVLAGLLGEGKLLVLGLPTLLVTGSYALFAAQSLETLPHPFSSATAFLRRRSRSRIRRRRHASGVRAGSR